MKALQMGQPYFDQAKAVAAVVVVEEQNLDLDSVLLQKLADFHPSSLLIRHSLLQDRRRTSVLAAVHARFAGHRIDCPPFLWDPFDAAAAADPSSDRCYC